VGSALNRGVTRSAPAKESWSVRFSAATLFIVRVSLVVPETVRHIPTNKRAILAYLGRAIRERPDLIVLPETVITGYQDTGDPCHDRSLCEEVQGEFLRSVAQLARTHRVLISIGFFEREAERICDACALFGPTGELLQHYRRIDPHRRHRGADPTIYACGEEVRCRATPHGRLATLICGDLFNDAVLETTQAAQPDHLLYALAADPEDDLTWEQAVASYYRQRLLQLGSYTLMVNLFESGEAWPDGHGGERSGSRIGGACVFSLTGQLLATLPSGSPGILTCTMPAGAAACDTL
jgi:predicted amidohydrolase